MSATRAAKLDGHRPAAVIFWLKRKVTPEISIDKNARIAAIPAKIIPMPIKSHTIYLHTPRLLLRPMTDDDWDIAAFAKAGFRVVDHITQPPGSKAHSTCDMRIGQTEWAAGANSSAVPT